MNKKAYITPAINMMTIEENLMAAVSNGVQDDGLGIGISSPISDGDASDAAAKGHGTSLWPMDDED